jgi:DNA-binding transcriptional ArsR family regulator
MSLRHSFNALHRGTCREILDILRRSGPKSVAEIHSRVKVGTRANVSQGLALLLKAEMVSMQRQGRNNLYQIRPAPFRELLTYLSALHRDARAATK